MRVRKEAGNPFAAPRISHSQLQRAISTCQETYRETRAGTQEIRRGCGWKAQERKSGRKEWNEEEGREASRARNIQPSLGYNESLDETVARARARAVGHPHFPFFFFSRALFVSRLLLLRPRPLLVPKKRRAIEARRPRTRSARVMYEKRLFISSRDGIQHRRVKLRVNERKRTSEGGRKTEKKESQKRVLRQVRSVLWISKKRASSDFL